ncbi:nuclear transport factor 2 family protein [Paraburkholderia sp. J67]|uniref:nuclear transport factor 2 family protein n=1 Tax=Paraburkholderia sp. J67 TaxID=2805435 RepID=UPI002ABD3161|nr:nuclear transport factor 2 family protein [Paraburkholderia sp. J67]
MKVSLRPEDAQVELFQFLEVWANRSPAVDQKLFSPTVTLSSGHRGNALGRADVINHLHSEFTGLSGVDIQATNIRVTATEREALVSAYFHGKAEGASSADEVATVLFGGVLIVEIGDDSGARRIQTIRVQTQWAEGSVELLGGWSLPQMKRQWRPGDPASVIVSELDAPWHRTGHASVLPTDEDAIADAWFRYAWALDQADFALLTDVFTEGAEAELPPMGHLRGQRTLIATLKAFRQPWPWMKHYGTPIAIDLSSDRSTADLVIARIMPGQTETEEGKPLFGAHYRIKAERGPDARWRISRMQYIPGWITA